MTFSQGLLTFIVCWAAGQVFGGAAERVHKRIAERRRALDDGRRRLLWVLAARTIARGPYR